MFVLFMFSLTGLLVLFLYQLFFVSILLLGCLRLITQTDMNNDVSEMFPADLDVCVSVVALYCLSSLCVAGSPVFS